MSMTHTPAVLWVMDACFLLPFGRKKIRVQSQMHKSKQHSGEPGRDGQARSHYCTFRLSEMEASELAEHAGHCGRSVSHLVRLRVLGHPPPLAAAPLANHALASELSKTNANLNQFVQHLNEVRATGKYPVIDLEDGINLVVKVDGNVRLLRADLVGASQK